MNTGANLLFNIMKRFLISFFALIFISGCQTMAEGPSFAEAKSVGSYPDMSTIYIYRVYAKPHSIGVDIFINNEMIATLYQRGFTWTRVKPGLINIKGDWPSLSGQKDSHISFNAESGKSYYVELTADSKIVGALPIAATGAVTFITDSTSGLHLIEPNVAEATLYECCKFQQKQ